MDEEPEPYRPMRPEDIIIPEDVPFSLCTLYGGRWDGTETNIADTYKAALFFQLDPNDEEVKALAYVRSNQVFCNFHLWRLITESEFEEFAKRIRRYHGEEE